MILNDKIIFSINRACKSSHPGGRPEARREGGLGSDGAEHVIVGAHRVVVHEQLASEGFVVEIAGKVAHRPFEVVAFLDDVPGDREAASTEWEKTLLHCPTLRSRVLDKSSASR